MLWLNRRIVTSRGGIGSCASAPGDRGFSEESTPSQVSTDPRFWQLTMSLRAMTATLIEELGPGAAPSNWDMTMLSRKFPTCRHCFCSV
jgi:hypothetical protein